MPSTKGKVVALCIAVTAAACAGESATSTEVVPDQSRASSDVTDGTRAADVLSDVTDRLTGRRWVLVDHTGDVAQGALRPTISFDIGNDGDRFSGLFIGGYEGCNWWASPIELAHGPQGPTMTVVGPTESTAMECFGEFEPAPRENVTYDVEFAGQGQLVLRSPDIELNYLDLHAIDGIAPITAGDLADSWTFPGSDRVELAATETGPMFRFWKCSTAVVVTSNGELELEREPDWSRCAAPTDGSGIGPLIDVLIDASGSERIPRAVPTLIADDVMYLFGQRSEVYRLERSRSTAPQN